MCTTQNGLKFQSSCTPKCVFFKNYFVNQMKVVQLNYKILNHRHMADINKQVCRQATFPTSYQQQNSKNNNNSSESSGEATYLNH